MTLTITHKYLRNILENLNNENYDDFLMELKYSTLIIPTNNGFPTIEINNKKYIPLFTDFYEFDKFNKTHEFRPIDHDFNYYLHFLMYKIAQGFIINPDSEMHIITRDILGDLKSDYIFEQDYQPFTVNEIRQLKDSIKNYQLNEFISDKSNWWDLDEIINKINDSLLQILLISDEKIPDEDGVISILDIIPKCLYEIGGKNYLLLFSRNVTTDSISDNVYAYSQIVNFPLIVESIMNNDFDGIILNIDEENITIPRQYLRNFMKGFSCPNVDDYSMYAFPVRGV